MHAFSNASFLRAAARSADLLPPGPPEIAFAGRSNVGKSSAINALAERRALARTSKTPGRTQTINLFDIQGGRLADLPGYGFARVSKELRDQWSLLMSAYLKERASLAAVVVVMDSRHPLTPLDAQLLDWLEEQRVLVLLSKADKLSRRDQGLVLADMEKRLAKQRGAETHLALFSSVTKQGVEECRDLLGAWLRDAGEQAAEIKSPR